MSAQESYWLETFEISMEEAGCGELLAQITPEQRRDVAGGIQGSHENYGMAFHTPENPMIDRNRQLERKLRWERELVLCRECQGRGRLEYYAGPWAVNTQCDKCHGAGRVHPRDDREPS